MTKTIRTQIDDRVLTVWFGANGTNGANNTLSPEVLDELEMIVDGLTSGEVDCKAVIFSSDRAGLFINGADLFALKRLDNCGMQRFLEHGQQVFDRIARLPMTTVVAINGNCLGGGLELALACDWRVAADVGSIHIGLPEINLGIMPAWGGTTRLTEMFGPAKALPLLLSGRTVPPRKARSLGIIDEVVRPEALPAAARRLARKTARTKSPKSTGAGPLNLLKAPWHSMVCATARRRTLAKTFGNYPATDRLIDAVHAACRHGHDAGLRAEREAVMDLASTDASINLMRLFYLRQSAKQSVKQKFNAPPTRIEHAAVIGGGTMGAGITHALIRGGIHTRLIDINAEAVSASLKRLKKMIAADLKSKRISPLEAEQAMHRVMPATDFTGLKLVDLAIEAVPEKMDIKQEVFQKLDRLTRNGSDSAVLASNTSSLSIADLAAVTSNPGRVIGLHFFNPVPKMPLLEVVGTAHSSDAALATGMELGLQIGKMPILVADAPGFLINRVLIPYLAEAMVMAAEGASIEQVDRAMKRWGMPMGPFELLDQIGLDVALGVLRSLQSSLGQRVKLPESVESALAAEHGHLGRKSGRGFYDYGRKGKGRPRPNPALLELLGTGKQVPDLDDVDIQWRLLLPMINETAQLLVDGVIDSTEIIDLATVLGLGLAPFRGGLARFIDTTGLDEIVRQMDRLVPIHGAHMGPVPAMRRAAESHTTLQELTLDQPRQLVTANH